MANLELVSTVNRRAAAAAKTASLTHSRIMIWTETVRNWKSSDAAVSLLA